MAIAFSAHQIKPTAAAVLFLERKCMLYFAKLESRKLIVLVAAAMVGAQDLERFLIATSRDKPSCIKLISGEGLRAVKHVWQLTYSDFLEPTRSKQQRSKMERSG